MDATRCLLAFLLLLLQAIAGASSDTKHLIAARFALRDPTGALAGWAAATNRSSPCRWAHVSCATNSTAAVAGVNLYNLTLGGAFPAALCSLRSLEQLDLSANQLMGPLPACVAALPALIHLNLAGNNFSGQVPPSWGAGFRSLAVLNLVQNMLSGEFPAFLANLTGLQQLQLAYNPIAPSPLPEKLFDLAGLRVLFIANCSLNGTIPSSVGKLKNLVNLDLSSNNLSEYAYTLHVTEKSDIYSFGVVILELVTGKKPMAAEIGEMDLVAWVSANIERNGLESVLDQNLAEQFKDEMCKVLKIALLCVSKLPIQRPPMRSVVTMLLEVKEENKPKTKAAETLPI